MGTQAQTCDPCILTIVSGRPRPKVIMALPSVLSFPILNQGENGSRPGMLEGGPRWGSDQRIASLGPLNPEGLAGASGRGDLWPAGAKRLHESADPLPHPPPLPPHRQEQVCVWEAPES